MNTYYDILEVSERASLDVINAAWKCLMRRYHADGSHPDEEKARQVNAAHAALEDPEIRRRYDLSLAQERQAELRQMQQEAAQMAHAFAPGSSQQGNYPNAYPPDIVQQAAMRMGLHVFENLVQQNPGLRFIWMSCQAIGMQKGRA